MNIVAHIAYHLPQIIILWVDHIIHSYSIKNTILLLLTIQIVFVIIIIIDIDNKKPLLCEIVYSICIILIVIY